MTGKRSGTTAQVLQGAVPKEAVAKNVRTRPRGKLPVVLGYEVAQREQSLSMSIFQSRPVIHVPPVAAIRFAQFGAPPFGELQLEALVSQ